MCKFYKYFFVYTILHEVEFSSYELLLIFIKKYIKFPRDVLLQLELFLIIYTWSYIAVLLSYFMPRFVIIMLYMRILPEVSEHHDNNMYVMVNSHQAFWQSTLAFRLLYIGQHQML